VSSWPLCRSTTSPSLKDAIMLVRVFLSYSHQDEELKKELLSHLSPLKKQGLIALWHDRMISAGTEWKNQIDTNLNDAHIILFLVSADFIASEYCYDIEMNRALERRDDQTVHVIPVIVRDCDWSSELFARLQAVPTDGKAVATWGDRYARDTAWKIVVREIGQRARIIKSELLLQQQMIIGLSLIDSIRRRSDPNADCSLLEYTCKRDDFRNTVRDAFESEDRIKREKAIADLQDGRKFGALVEKDILWIFREARLKKYLKSQQWPEADEETLQLILLMVETYTAEDLSKFPGDKLRLLDDLWVTHSKDEEYPKGRFGLSVQRDIYLQNCGGSLDTEPSDEIWKKFGVQVGWRVNDNWRLYPPCKPYLRGSFPDFKMCQNRMWMWSLFSHKDL
jgi:hypothetical protein